MIDFELTPRAGGDPVKLTADMSDAYFWEKTHKGKTLRRLLEDKSAVDLYEVACIAAQRQGIFAGTDVDEFARTYVMDTADDEEDVDPTRPGR